MVGDDNFGVIGFVELIDSGLGLILSKGIGFLNGNWVSMLEWNFARVNYLATAAELVPTAAPPFLN